MLVNIIVFKKNLYVFNEADCTAVGLDGVLGVGFAKYAASIICHYISYYIFHYHYTSYSIFHYDPTNLSDF